MFFSIVFSCFLATKMEPQMSQNRSKIDFRTHFALGSVSSLIFDGFWLSNRPPRHPISLKNRWFLYYLSDGGVFVLRCVLAATLLSIWLHFGTKNDATSTKKAIKKDFQMLIVFSIICLMIFAPFGDPIFAHWGHFGLKSGATELRPRTTFASFAFFWPQTVQKVGQ